VGVSEPYNPCLDSQEVCNIVISTFHVTGPIYIIACLRVILFGDLNNETHPSGGQEENTL
jgi:hypothetical protein